MLDYAIDLARQAGKILHKGFGIEVTAHEESRYDIKLEMDLRCEELILGGIRREFPGHSILSEESGSSNTGSPYEWIVDPLDGTVNYARSIPHFCTSIALRKDGVLILGVVYDPMRDELFTAERGKGASVGGSKLQASTTGRLQESILSCGFTKDDETVARGAAILPKLATSVRKVRITGSAALDLAYVACGRFDAYFQYGIYLWDIAAASLMLEEAGGTPEVLDSINPYRFDYMASNGKVHEELRSLL